MLTIQNPKFAQLFCKGSTYGQIFVFERSNHWRNLWKGCNEEGVIIMDHGSHREESNLMLRKLNLYITDVVDDRIKHCLRHVYGDADECSICAGTGKCRL